MSYADNESTKLRKINRYFLDDTSKYLTDVRNTLDDYFLHQRTMHQSRYDSWQHRNSSLGLGKNLNWNERNNNLRQNNTSNPKNTPNFTSKSQGKVKKLLVSDKVYSKVLDASGPQCKNRFVNKKCYCSKDYDCEHKCHKIKPRTIPTNAMEDTDTIKEHSFDNHNDLHKIQHNNIQNIKEKPIEKSHQYSVASAPRKDLHKSLDSSKTITPDEIELLRRFRDKFYFECHSIKSDSKVGKSFKCILKEVKDDGSSQESQRPIDKCKCCRCNQKEKPIIKPKPVDKEKPNENSCICDCRQQKSRPYSLDNYSTHNNYEPEIESDHSSDVTESTVPKYIVKIPEICIKLPITHNILQQKNTLFELHNAKSKNTKNGQRETTPSKYFSTVEMKRSKKCQKCCKNCC